MPTPTTIAFGALLKQLRKRAGMTQRDLAAALNYSDSFISSLENAQRQPDVDAVIAHFIPALGLHDDPTTAAHLIERAAAARGERPPDPVTLYHITHGEKREEQDRHPSALPTPSDELIGRDEEVYRLCNRLLGHHGRLMTLVGPPGIGKTRLALAVAARLERHYPDGALFVPLAAVADAITMASTIVAAVGSSEASVKPPQVRLIEVLRRKHMLLVLDNCEQIAGAAPLIAEVVAACPQLSILATSRERLHLRAEQRYRVPPLELAAAVKLFALRAAAVDVDFTTTAASRPTLEAICQRLDRLPLAIELCAAQVDLLSPTQILAQLRARPLDLLVDGAHDLPPQHRTLRHAIQRSYELLADHERVLFRRLGIFVGGWSLEAMEAVCEFEQAADGRTLVETLHALIGKSLVRAETLPTGERRFMMLEMIREYALEHLAAGGELELLQRQHAAYFVTLAEAGVPHDRLEMDHANLRAALAWSRTEADGTTGLRLVVALDWFWRHSGYLSEGRHWLADALAPRENGASWPDTPASRSLRAKALARLGMVAGWQNDLTAAQPALEESLALFRELGDIWSIADTLNALGITASLCGDYERSAALLEESLTLFRQLEDTNGIAEYYHFMAHLAYVQDNLTRAAELWEQGLSLFRQVENTWMIAGSHLNLGVVALDQGDKERARAYLAEGLTRFREEGERWAIVQALEEFAGLAAAQAEGRADAEGAGRRAARLFGTAEALRETIGGPVLPLWRDHYQRWVATARSLLDEATFRAAWTEGRAMNLEQAISYALEESNSDEVSLRDDER